MDKSSKNTTADASAKPAPELLGQPHLSLMSRLVRNHLVDPEQTYSGQVTLLGARTIILSNEAFLSQLHGWLVAEQFIVPEDSVDVSVTYMDHRYMPVKVDSSLSQFHRSGGALFTVRACRTYVTFQMQPMVSENGSYFYDYCTPTPNEELGTFREGIDVETFHKELIDAIIHFFHRLEKP